MKCLSWLLFAFFFSFLVSGCMTEEPEEGECITAFDCGEGYDCINNVCVEIPDDSGYTDKAWNDTGEGDGAWEEQEEGAVFFDDKIADMYRKDENAFPEEKETDEDLFSDEGDVGDDDVMNDTTPPTVSATNPSPNETNVGVGTAIEITFSEPMNEASLTASTIQVKQGATSVGGTVSYTASTFTATFTPSAALLYNTTYTVTVTTGVVDMAGNHLASPYLFSFTTAAEEINECVTMNNPCDDQGDVSATCTDVVGSYSCACSSGFTFSGGTCQDINECLIANGGCDSLTTCTNTVGGRTCGPCPSGYSGSGETGCSDINECTTLFNPCDNNGDTAGQCHNTSGSYYCVCSSGFTDNGGACVDVDECVANPCNDNGDANAGCTNYPGTYDCSCSSGFVKTSGTCQDVNECASGNGGCAQTCTNTVGSYSCSCASGYVLNADGKSCDDIDECVAQSNPCDNNGDAGAVCTNLPGSYSCTCSGGFTFSGGSCQDVNECIQGTHNCDAHATCTNTVGSFTCSCNAYYTGNGITCTFCNTDGQCGATCTACGGGTPYCKDYGNGTTQCVQCRTDGDCTSGYVCNTSNQCVQPVPPESCTTGTQSRDRCSNARIIGRSTAKTSSGYVISDNTCSAYNRVDQSSGCYDAGADHVYRIYLRAGETAAITLSNSWACPAYSSSYWNSTLAIYNDVGCGSSARVWCDDYFEGTKSYTAPADGWYYIVVDGSTAFDDEGDYTLTVKLQNCVTTGCNCP